MYIQTIDIAHPPLRSEAAEKLLDDELRIIRSSNEFRVLKVIHGYGTDERPGILKEVVQNWAYRNKSKLRAHIPGEEYDMFDQHTIAMRKECGQIQDPDLGIHNRGVTLFWIK